MMNRNRLLLLLALFLFPVFASAQTAPDAAELTRLLNQFLDGAGRNDVAIHERFWADDLIYTRGVGQRIDKAELMKGVRAPPAAKPDDPVTVYTAEEVKIQQYGNAAVVAFKLVGTTKRKDGTTSVSNHLNTGTFIKRKGQWQAVAWQATPVPQPKTEPTTSSATTSSAKATALSTSSGPGDRKYFRGSRGGCYYLNSSGKKTYVEKALCN
jgi:hypothetical protein